MWADLWAIHAAAFSPPSLRVGPLSSVPIPPHLLKSRISAITTPDDDKRELPVLVLFHRGRRPLGLLRRLPYGLLRERLTDFKRPYFLVLPGNRLRVDLPTELVNRTDRVLWHIRLPIRFGN